MPKAERPEDAPRPARSAGWLRSSVIWVGLIAPWLLVALLAWSDRPYLLDLASHFLLHAGAALAVPGLVLLACRRWWFGCNLVLVASVIGLGWRMTVSAPTGHRPEDPLVVRLVAFNAQEELSRHDNDAFEWIRSQRPDVIVLIEAPWGVLNDYPDLRREYPYSIEPSAGLMWSVVMLSRFPATIEPLTPYSEESKFSFAARRSLLVTPPGGKPFLLSAMHPPSPRSRVTWEKSLEGTALNGRLFREWSEARRLPVVVAGDFNSSPAGRVHRTFARTSGLRGWSPMLNAGTWPAWMPKWCALPIDRVWTGGGAEVASITVGPRFRSDHRPLMAEIVLPRASAEPAPGPRVPSEGPADSVR